MNPTLDVILKRRSVRAYENRPISPEIRAQILEATLRAPTAGNMMLYTIIDVTDQHIKDKLAITCDKQPLIAQAPMVWLFLADYQRWYDYFIKCRVEEVCRQKGLTMRKPEEGDLFLACCDALIAAQTAVIAAEALGVGSCYIGDIMEQYETNREIFNLPQYTFPICLLCLGYPTEGQRNRKQPTRFDKKFIIFENQYHRLEDKEFDEMFFEQQAGLPPGSDDEWTANIGQRMYMRKFSADFSVEMSRSVRTILKTWMGE